jgi:hypothetical protein
VIYESMATERVTNDREVDQEAAEVMYERGFVKQLADDGLVAVYERPVIIELVDSVLEP